MGEVKYTVWGDVMGDVHFKPLHGSWCSWHFCAVCPWLCPFRNGDYQTFKITFSWNQDKSATNSWSLVDTEKYRNIHKATMKVASLLVSTYLYLFLRICLFLTWGEWNLNSWPSERHSITVALSGYTPDYPVLVDIMQCHISHWSQG